MIKGIKKHVLMQLQKHLNKGGVIMTPFATIDDLTNLWRPMSADEQTRATGLLPVVSNRLRQEADNVGKDIDQRSEEHTSELQSRGHLVCRLLLEKKKQSG